MLSKKTEDHVCQRKRGRSIYKKMRAEEKEQRIDAIYRELMVKAGQQTEEEEDQHNEEKMRAMAKEAMEFEYAPIDAERRRKTRRRRG